MISIDEIEVLALVGFKEIELYVARKRIGELEQHILEIEGTPTAEPSDPEQQEG